MLPVSCVKVGKFANRSWPKLDLFSEFLLQDRSVLSVVTIVWSLIDFSSKCDKVGIDGLRPWHLIRPLSIVSSGKSLLITALLEAADL